MKSLLLGSLALLVAHSLWFGDWIADDAAISFTYAHNLAEHGELSLFPGGERTEGFSNPLWVLLVATLTKLGLFHAVVTPKILGLLLQALSLVLVTALAQRLVPTSNRWVKHLPALLLATCSGFVVWGVSGLETPLLTVLLLASMLKLMRDGEQGPGGWSLGVLFFLIAFTRPEGILYGAMIWLLLAGRCLVTGRLGRESRRARCLVLLRFSCTLGAPLLAVALARWFYFDDVAPNPYYAKIGDRMIHHSFADTLEAGWTYAQGGLRSQSWNLLLPLAAFSLTCLRRFELIALWSLVLAALVLPVCAGGDSMMEYRLLSPLYPLYLLTALVGWKALSAHIRTESLRNFHVLVAILALCVLVGGTAQGWQRSRRAKDRPPVAMQTVEDQARSLRTYADALGLEHATAMIPDAGGSSYFGSRNNLEILDLGGLGDRFLGRLGLGEHTWEYVLELHRPDFIGFRAPWSDALDIQRSPRFREFYQPIREDRDALASAPGREGQPSLKSGLYVRRDLIAVPVDSVLRPVLGEKVGGLRFRGWGGPEVTRAGHVRVTTYWEVISPWASPIVQLDWKTVDGETQGSKESPVAGGCYTPEFARVGDIVPTSVVLDSLPEAVIGQPLQLSVVAKHDKRWVPISLGTEIPAPAPHVDSAEILRQGRELIAEGNLEACLDEILGYRDRVIPALDSNLQQIQRELARAFFDRAQEQERSPEFLSLAPQIWRDSWNGWRACKGFSPALVKTIDYWPLRQAMTGSRVAISTRAHRISWSESTTLHDVYRGLASSIFSFHDFRLAKVRDRIPESPLPTLSQPLLYLRGWLKPEAWGRWSVLKTAHVYVQKAGASAIRVRAATWEAMSEPQWVNVYFEGEYLGSKWVQGPRWEMNDYEFYLPAEPTHGVVSLQVKRLFSEPSPLGLPRALPVESIEVVASPTRE